MDVAIKSVLEQLKSRLESLQKALEQVGNPDSLSHSQRDFYNQVQESLHHLKNTSQRLEFQIEQTVHQQTQKSQERSRQAAAQLTELEAQVEAIQQQVRLLRGERERHRQFHRDEREVLEEQVQALKQALRAAESRIAVLEAESLENRTWAIGLNIQRQVAQKTVDELRTVVEQKRSQLQEQTGAASRQEKILLDQQTLAESQTKLITDLKRDLTTAHRTIEALEQQVAQRNRQQLSILQARQESSVLHHQDQVRQETLEEQTRTYQSQIAEQTEELRQSQQSVQRWREQALAYEHQLHNIRDWLEQFPETMIPKALEELIAAPIPNIFDLSEDAPSPPSPSTAVILDQDHSNSLLERETLNLPQFPQ